MLFTYEKIQSLNDLEFTVYNAIVELDHQVLEMKIRQLAERAHVSTTVVLNFCKKMECDGWTSFKLKFKENLSIKSSVDEKKFNPILEHLLVQNEDKKKQKQLHKVVEIIYKARRIIFIGAGPSGVMAKYGALYLSNMGKSAQHIDQPYYPTPTENHSEDVIIGLSVSGETESLIHRLNRFKELGAKIISITNVEKSTMTKMSDISLIYYVPQEELNISERMTQVHVNVTTQIPVMYFIETIARMYRELMIKNLL